MIYSTVIGCQEKKNLFYSLSAFRLHVCLRASGSQEKGSLALQTLECHVGCLGSGNWDEERMSR